MLRHWTVSAIRAKADALEARGAGRITLATETVDLLVSALRFLAAEGMADRRDAYAVDVWDKASHIIEHIGSLSHHGAARAAFDAACEACGRGRRSPCGRGSGSWRCAGMRDARTME